MKNRAEKSLSDSKKALILSAVVNLVESGVDAEKITARQIAGAAGIGKSTIYEHFDTKDEILCTAFAYFVDSQINILKGLVEEKSDFKGKMYAFYGYLYRETENPNSVFKTILEQRGAKISDLQKIKSRDSLRQMRRQVTGIFTDILRRGEAENIIKPAVDPVYVGMVFVGNIFSFCSRREDGANDRQRITKNAYEILIKRLN